jgi:hypothetical protein
MEPSWYRVLQHFRITPGSFQSFQDFLSVVLLIVVGGLVWGIISSFRHKKKMVAVEWNWFEKLEEEYDLSEDEAEILEVLARNYFLKTPHKLLQSVDEFDGIVEKFLGSDYRLALRETDEEIEADLETIRHKVFHKRFHSTDELSSTRQIPPGQKIRLIIPQQEQQYVLNSTVAENTLDGISVQCPELSDMKGILIPGILINGYYWRERDAGYQFQMTLKRIIDETHIECAHTEQFVRKQRRHYFRVHVRLTGRFYKITEEEVQFFERNHTFPALVYQGEILGKIVSLSGGGLAFFTDSLLSTHDILRIEILGRKGVQFLGIAGKVIRIRQFDSKRKVYVEFISLTEQSREAIVQYISLQQRLQTTSGFTFFGNK